MVDVPDMQLFAALAEDVANLVSELAELAARVAALEAGGGGVTLPQEVKDAVAVIAGFVGGS